MGLSAEVLHPLPGYRLKWLSSNPPVNPLKRTKQNAHFIVPEVCANFLKRLKAHRIGEYSILVQNGHFIFNTDTRLQIEELAKFYSGAKCVFVVSDHSKHLLLKQFPNIEQKIVVFRPHWDHEMFTPKWKQKKQTITYMPRKDPYMSEIVTRHLMPLLPKSWEIKKIDNMSEIDVSETLSESRIFLSFAGLEGLGVPPIEAGLAGNFVIGNAGTKYPSPLFRSPQYHYVEKDDVEAYLSKTLQLVEKFDSETSMDLLQPSVNKIVTYLTKEHAYRPILASLENLSNGDYTNKSLTFSYFAYVKERTVAKFSKFLSKIRSPN